MTNEERRKIAVLQKEGLGYRRIASKTGLNPNTVKSFCKAHPIHNEQGDICMHCGKEVRHTPHKRKKKYCSDACRAAWWSAHPEARKNSQYEHICAFCGKEFYSDRSESKYCSTLCFANARKKVTQHD